ncbi:MAG: hypothetical protein ABW189_06010 [Rickettsiales bacterium]
MSDVEEINVSLADMHEKKLLKVHCVVVGEGENSFERWWVIFYEKQGDGRDLPVYAVMPFFDWSPEQKVFKALSASLHASPPTLRLFTLNGDAPSEEEIGDDDKRLSEPITLRFNMNCSSDAPELSEETQRLYLKAVLRSNKKELAPLLSSDDKSRA